MQDRKIVSAYVAGDLSTALPVQSCGISGGKFRILTHGGRNLEGPEIEKLAAARPALAKFSELGQSRAGGGPQSWPDCCSPYSYIAGPSATIVYTPAHVRPPH